MQRSLPLLLLVFAACSGTDDPDDDGPSKDSTSDTSVPGTTGDTGPAACGSEPATMEVGTGSDIYVWVSDLDTVEVIFGPQGGYHMVTAARMCHMAPLVTVHIRLVDELTGATISDVSYLAPTYEDVDCCRYRPDMYGFLDLSTVDLGGLSPGQYLDGKVVNIEMTVIEQLTETGVTPKEASGSVRVTAEFNED